MICGCHLSICLNVTSFLVLTPYWPIDPKKKLAADVCSKLSAQFISSTDVSHLYFMDEEKKEWVNVYAMLSDTSEGQINIAWEKVPKTFPIELTVQPIVWVYSQQITEVAKRCAESRETISCWKEDGWLWSEQCFVTIANTVGKSHTGKRPEINFRIFFPPSSTCKT